jgi:asparagine synthase (glutamine-hydrolysing)
MLFSEKQLEEVLLKAVYHAETPVLRMAMAPLFSLSGLVRNKGFKAVVGGEGADEILLGYDLYKEVKVRQFWARQPQSRWRGRLFARLYPYLPALREADASYLGDFFSKGFRELSDPFYSHRARWDSAGRSQRFFTGRFRALFNEKNCQDEILAMLPGDFKRWDPMARAQYLECKLFLSNYLLSSQGDRMAMANAVEVRFPYLDHRLVDWAAQVSPHIKMRGLNEKSLLKKVAAPLLPASILERKKYPYRAPGILFQALKNPANRLSLALSTERVREAGYFDPEMLSMLVSKFRQGEGRFSEADQMALSGALTLQLVHEFFIEKGAKAIA